MRKEEKNFAHSCLMEGMTSIRAVIEANQKQKRDARPILRIWYDEQKRSKISKELGWLSHRAEELDFDLVPTDAATIDAMSTGNTHGGILAECGERRLPSLSEESIVSDGFYVMIEGIEDPYNFGYALRSLYAFGVDGIILPERNWMTAAGVVARASAGASERFDMMIASSSAEAADLFAQKGFSIVCADEKGQKVLGQCVVEHPVFLIVGGEKRGISASLLARADLTLRIPYGRDFGSALSAASAATVLAYEISKYKKR